MKNILPLLMLCLSFNIHAQNIYGKVIQEFNSKPIAYADIIIEDLKNSDILVEATSNEKGEFKIDVPHQNIRVIIESFGFKTKKIENLKFTNKISNLGDISIQTDAQIIGDVFYRAEKSQMVYQLDKKVFNVGSDLTSSGASTLEILENVPSVDVSIDGVVSLRGNSSVKILIDGNPSSATSNTALASITSDMIDRIEVITNPSVKYEAEGSAGILNIILKKNNKEGLNGSISLNTGFPNNHSVALSLSKRTKKFNLFTQIGAGLRTNPSKTTGYTKDKIENTQLNYDGVAEKNEKFINLRLGTDYYLNKQNVITLSGTFAMEDEDESSTMNYQHLEDNALIGKSNRFEKTEAINPKYGYDLNYKKTFDKKDQSFVFNANGSYFGKDKTSNFTNLESQIESLQNTRTDFYDIEYNFSADYTHPFTKKQTLEAGLKTNFNDISNDYSVENLEQNIWVNDPNLTNTFTYNQAVYGAYATYGKEFNKLGIKAGLRYELTELKTNLKNTEQQNTQSYSDLFPSLHASYNFHKNNALQIGYSRRIQRPDMWSLNPFTNLRDAYNVSTGNPDLRPEYSDTFELTNIQKWDKSDLSISLFGRKTTDVINHIVSLENGISTRTSLNVGTSNNYGVELNHSVRFTPWLKFISNFNYQNFKRTGSYQEQNFDFKSSSWSGRVSTKIRLMPKLNSELKVRYRSKVKEVVYTNEEMWFVDLGLKQKFNNGKFVLGLNVRDLFNSRQFNQTAIQESFDQYNSRVFGGRRITFSLNYSFGKGEAQGYSGGGHQF